MNLSQKIFYFILNDKAFQLRSTSLNAKSLAVLNGYIFVPFKHTPVPIKGIVHPQRKIVRAKSE